jgi:ATP-dependent helicase/nuclease subunit B
MKTLHVHPTSRALRKVTTTLLKEDGMLPELMRMDEFEKRAILIGEYSMVDPLKRIVLLQEAANFQAFQKLKVDKALVRFFTKSESIFKFFEELAVEEVDFAMLREADAYAEFGEHIEVLQALYENYKTLLHQKGLTDKALIPQSYRLNRGFIKNYGSIEIYLEGYLSHYELKLLSQIAKETTVILHYHTSRFNGKMQERFVHYGMTLPKHATVSFNFSTKELLKSDANQKSIKAEIYSVEERLEQVALAFEKIDEMVQQGLEPSNIVLILPDESFKPLIELYDKHNNLNFAMGHSYQEREEYKKLEALYKVWQHFDKDAITLLEHYGVAWKKEGLITTKEVGVTHFFDVLDFLGMEGHQKNERVAERYNRFVALFEGYRFSYTEWLFIWLKLLNEVTLDDVHGGLVTVMGVLETRGISFDGVVIVDFNDGIVPATSTKDQFLNTQVRAFAKLPTKKDRESLQKQYYKRLLEEAKKSVILYSTSGNKLPSKFLYELGLHDVKQVETPLYLLYNEASQLQEQTDPKVEQFDAGSMKWSATRLKSWLSCKRQFYYRYIEKIERKEEEEPNEGLVLHQVLEKLFVPDEAFSSLEALQKRTYQLLDEIFNDKRAIATYKKLLWQKKLEPFFKEQLQHLKHHKVVATEKYVEGSIEGLAFSGRIDRVDQNETETWVLDYKSSQGSIKKANITKDIETKLTDFQMSIYHALLQPYYHNIHLAYIPILDEGKAVEITALEEKTEVLKEHLKELKKTTSFTANRCEDTTLCVWCEFALVCERGEYS